MSFRFPLLLKKRGGRRTGSQRWARAGELLYQLMFVIVGLVFIWWVLYDTLIPEWRLMQSAAKFEKTTCTIVGHRVAERPGLTGREYCPELQIEFEIEPRGRKVVAWTRHGVGRDGPSIREARAYLNQYKIGDERDCWFDPKQPTNPERVLISVTGSWIPYIVLAIPGSLVIAGLVGFARALVGTRSSPEHRSSLIHQGVDLRMLEIRPSKPTVASALPSSESINDSPGTKLAFRLPMDDTEGWRVIGMAIVCGMWNLLAGLFVYQWAANYFSVGGRIGLSLLAVIPLAATSAWLLHKFWQDAGTVGGVGVTRVELSKHPLRPGMQCDGILLQAGRLKSRGLSINLICEEIAIYRNGTDTRIANAEVFREALLQEKGVSVSSSEPLQREINFQIPESGPVSFASPHNEVRWAIEVVVGHKRRPEVRRIFPICVYPIAWPSADYATTAGENVETAV